MSDLEKAAKDAIDAAANSEQLALIAAVLQAQELTRQQHQQPVPPAPVAQPSGSAAKWLAIGAAGSALLIAVAVSAIAIAISAVAVTACLVVLRSMWRDYQKGR